MRRMHDLVLNKFLTTFLVMIFFTLCVESFRINNRVNEFKAKYLDTARVLAGSSSLIFLKGTNQDFKSLIKSLDLSDEYKTIRAFKEGGEFSSIGVSTQFNNLNKNFESLSFRSFTFKTPVTHNGVHLGYIGIQISTNLLTQAIQIDILNFLVILGVMIFLFLSAFRSIRNELVVPFGNLHEGINKILKSRDLSVRVLEDYQVYEAKELSSLFNKMICEIEESRVDLNLMNKSLENLVSLKTKKLSNALDDMRRFQSQLVAQEKLASLGTLSAGIAHEIKNPLNLIINSAQIICMQSTKMAEKLERLEVDPSYTDDIKKIRKFNKEIDSVSSIISSNGYRADSIIKSMLSQSRTTKSAISKTNLSEITNQALNLSTHARKSQSDFINIEFITSVQEDIYINCVSEDVERVLINIFDNAFYAMKEFSRRNSSDYHAILETQLYVDTDKTIIKISDNGSGMSPEVLDRIFEPFFTTKPTGEGTGLGMGMVNDIIKSHNGKLLIDTTLFKGTSVTITFPFMST